METAFISGNRDRLKRMFGNLLSNAIRYSRQGGKVQLAIKDNVDSYLFSVADDGIGVPEKEQKKIFQGFYRTKGARLATDQGTGLGLYYIKQVVDLHKGQIWLKSEENKGSTFFVKLKK
ncbi:MAG: sensor histidine kinase [bacterium]|nr:sensor histidine kinase [bacterium]